MGRRTWFKLYPERWIHGSIRAEEPIIRATFVDLLAMAGDSHLSDQGVIQVAAGVGYTDEGLSSILNIPLETWKIAKERLSNHPDKAENRIEIHPEKHGFSIKIINWSRYQSEYQRQKPYRQQKLQPKLHKKLRGEGEVEGEGEGEVDKHKTTPLPPSGGIGFNGHEIPTALDTAAFRIAFIDFQKHRAEIKKPLTPTSARKLLHRLEKMGSVAAVEAINHSISNGWRGIFAPERESKTGGRIGGMTGDLSK